MRSNQKLSSFVPGPPSFSQGMTLRISDAKDLRAFAEDGINLQLSGYAEKDGLTIAGSNQVIKPDLETLNACAEKIGVAAFSRMPIRNLRVPSSEKK